MPFFISFELKSVTQSNVVGGTVRSKRFPPTTLIRLYELLKNDSRSFDRTPKQSSITWASDEAM